MMPFMGFVCFLLFTVGAMVVAELCRIYIEKRKPKT